MISIKKLFPTLSPRQSQVCAKLIQGLSVKQIAYELNMSHKTVEEHKTAIYMRTNTANIVGLMRKAFGPALIVLE